MTLEVVDGVITRQISKGANNYMGSASITEILMFFQSKISFDLKTLGQSQQEKKYSLPQSIPNVKIYQHHFLPFNNLPIQRFANEVTDGSRYIDRSRRGQIAILRSIPPFARAAYWRRR